MTGRDLSADLFGTPDTGRDLSSELFKPAKDAGFSLKDIGVAFGQGAVSSTEALTNVAGAGNAA